MRVLILVDIQNDFLPGGALAVPRGDEVVPVANALMQRFDLVVATQDWHPSTHGSFASQHSGRKVGEVVDLGGLPQVLWPDHCVQGTSGAELSSGLNARGIRRVFKKGIDPRIDSYSGFFDNGHRRATGLAEYLEQEGVEDVYVMGLATDYCVKFTALDARRLGFGTYLIEDGCRGVELKPLDIARAIDEMKSEGVRVVRSDEVRLARARLSLEGLSVGDAFGEWFFSPMAPTFFAHREMPPKPWRYTDDTAMAVSIVEILHEHGQIDQDALAQRFAERFTNEPNRGYGGMASQILREIARGAAWSDVSRRAFGGMGSLGNGGAMRAGPIGAWFADDLETAAEQARLSAEVTHAHPEGQAGAVAVAVAAAQASRLSGRTDTVAGGELLRAVIDHTPDGPTRDGLLQALRLDFDRPIAEAARVLGNGSRVVSGDTVPFAVWSAARHLGEYEEAMWATVSAWGDMDTTCAIVGSIVAMTTGLDGIPELWRRSREPLDLACGG